MCLFMAPSGRMRSGSMIFIIAAGWWPFRGLSRIWTPWTLPPYTPGALRGGSHVHVYSPNGQFVSFTYNDHVLHERDPALDLRNVGVAAPYGLADAAGTASARIWRQPLVRAGKSHDA